MKNKQWIAFVALAPAILLAGCGEPRKPSYEVGAKDESGGKLIVEEVNPNEVPVNVPDTPMVPADKKQAQAGDAGDASETGAQ